jgi:hypothetical protein
MTNMTKHNNKMAVMKKPICKKFKEMWKYYGITILT